MCYLPACVAFTPLISNETLMNKGFQNAYKQRDVSILKLITKYKSNRRYLFILQYGQFRMICQYYFGLNKSLTILLPDEFCSKSQPVVSHFNKIRLYTPKNKFFKSGDGKFFQVCMQSGIIKVIFQFSRETCELYSLNFPYHGCFECNCTGNYRLCEHFVHMACAKIGCENKHIQFIEVHIKACAGIWSIFSRGCQGKNVMLVDKIGNSFFGKAHVLRRGD